MRTLRVQAGEVTNDRCSVEWRIDESQWKGVINVTLPTGIEDGAQIAELCAIKHLIVERMIFGSRNAPRNATIIVSFGALKKLQRQESSKTNIIQYGRFLFATLNGCAMAVKKDRTLSLLPRKPVIKDDVAVGEEGDVEIKATKANWTMIPFALWDGQPIGITRHAIERYMERFETPYIMNALAGINKILTSNEVRELVKPEEARARDNAKHLAEGRMFEYGPSQTRFVLVREEDHWVMATIHRNDDRNKLKEAVYSQGRVEIRNKR